MTYFRLSIANRQVGQSFLFSLMSLDIDVANPFTG